MALILTILVHFPLVPAVPFLSFDPKDVVIAVGGFVYGPLAAMIVSLMTSVLELFFRGGTIIDVIMNVIATCTFACVATYVYKKNHTLKGAVIGLVLGSICCTISMVIWNYIMDPIYFQIPREAVIVMLPYVALFNVLKCGLNSIITMLVYKPIVRALRSGGLVKESESVKMTTKNVWIVGIFLLVSVILFILGFNGII